MEKKKIILVAVSVGVFLVIVIGASILVFSPKAPSPVASAGSASSGTPVERPLSDEMPPAVNIVDGVKNPEIIQDIEAPPSIPSSDAPSNKPKDNIFYIYGENPNQTTAGEQTGPKNNQVVIDVPSPSPVVRTQPKVSAPAARSSPPAQTPPARKPEAPAAKPEAPASQKLIDNYWVQTGSFSTKTRAETVKETLSTKGISSLIETREVNGKTFFRVRVGPYTSRNEADYWLALIKAIDGFEESQVWKTQTAQ